MSHFQLKIILRSASPSTWKPGVGLMVPGSSRRQWVGQSEGQWLPSAQRGAFTC